MLPLLKYVHAFLSRYHLPVDADLKKQLGHLKYGRKEAQPKT